MKGRMLFKGEEFEGGTKAIDMVSIVEVPNLFINDIVEWKTLDVDEIEMKGMIIGITIYLEGEDKKNRCVSYKIWTNWTKPDEFRRYEYIIYNLKTTSVMWGNRPVEVILNLSRFGE